MKCILIISAVYPPEPVVSARLSFDLCQALKKKGYDVKVLHPRPTRPNGFGFDNNINLGEEEIVINSYTCPQSLIIGRMRESFSFGKACSDYIKEHHKEISYVYANAWPIGSQYRLLKAAMKYGIPVAMHIQDVYPESISNKRSLLVGKIMKGFLLPMDKFILRNCDQVIAISEKMKEYLVKTRGIDAAKCSVVINWQDEKEFLDYQKAAKSKEQHPFTFMYMGNIGPVAGVDLLIDAFSLAKIKDSRLVIAGSGSMKDMLIEKSKNIPYIEFWEVPNGKVPEIQDKADVMLLPIKKGAATSSIPSKLPAYMFSAKPIIGCMDADSDTADAINQAECGWVIEPENPRLLSEKMTTVASLNSTCLKEYGEKALRYGLAHFSKRENLKKLTNIIMIVSQKGEKRLK